MAWSTKIVDILMLLSDLNVIVQTDGTFAAVLGTSRGCSVPGPSDNRSYRNERGQDMADEGNRIINWAHRRSTMRRLPDVVGQCGFLEQFLVSTNAEIAGSVWVRNHFVLLSKH
jgi:hypothetical protein